MGWRGGRDVKGLTPYERATLSRPDLDGPETVPCAPDCADQPCTLNDIPNDVLDNLTMRGLVTWRPCEVDEGCYHYRITPVGRILLSVQGELEAG